MRIRPLQPAAAAFLLGLALTGPAAAGSPDADLKAAIDSMIHRFEDTSQGALKWDGADKMEIKKDGDGAVADISGARILGQDRTAQPPATKVKIGLDHLQIRWTPKPDNMVEVALGLPAAVSIQPSDGDEVTVTLKEATARTLIEAQTERPHESSVSIAGARVEDKKGGDWVTLGPLSGSTKITSAADGSWSQPMTFEMKQIEAFFAKNKAGGTVDRIAYEAKAAGPDLAALYRVRDRLTAMQAQFKAAPQENLDGLFGVVGDMVALISQADGEFTVENVKAHGPGAVPVFTLAKAMLGGKLDGMSGDTAKFRITYKHDGMALDPSLPVAGQVPKRMVFDFGIEDVATAPLRKLIDLALAINKTKDPGEKQRDSMQLFGAAAMLSPDIHIYDLTFDAKEFGVDGNAEVKGSPISPKGYSAQGDVTVRSLDVVARLYPVPFVTAYVPLLQEVGKADKAPDGAPLTRFHLASAPPKWLQLNGVDVTPWFAGGSDGGARKLHLAVPPMTGDDVRAVQQALAAKGTAPQTGSFDGATAVAVARFQKANGLNADGVVDAATRDKLGIKTAAPQPGGPGGAPPRPGTPPRPN